MKDFTQNKVLTGIKFFVKNTRNVGRTKLFKLLYFWDFFHFKKYGFSVTGYQYYTFPFGPVPLQLYNQIVENKLPKELQDELRIVEDDSNDDDFNEYKRFKVLLKNNSIDFDWLSPIEKETLEIVTDIFKYATAKEMTEITHLHNSPWDQTVKENGMDKSIDYRLAVDDESSLDTATIEELLTLQKEIYHNGRLE
jgi:uncharacterized phage-associated protein